MANPTDRLIKDIIRDVEKLKEASAEAESVDQISTFQVEPKISTTHSTTQTGSVFYVGSCYVGYCQTTP